MIRKRILILATLIQFGMPLASAHAGWRFGAGVRLGCPAYYYPYPYRVYVAPAPVYVAPAPVYVQPVPSYVQPVPVYVTPSPAPSSPAPAALSLPAQPVPINN